MTRHRPRRVGDQLRAILAQLVQREVKDPGLGFVTLTEVRMSSDVRYATVFVSVMGGPEAEEESLRTLRRAAPYLRGEVGKRLRLRHTPEIRFELDQTLAHSDHIERLLAETSTSETGEGDRHDDE